MKRYQLFAFGVAVISGSTARAHPGHGEGIGSSELAHYLSEPAHLATIVVGVAMLLAIVGMWTAYRRTPGKHVEGTGS